MSAPATLEALLILGLVFVPGYLFLIFARRSNIGAPEKLEARDFLMMLAIGATIHLLALLVPFGTPWLIGWYVEGSRDEQLGLVGLWALFVIILGPIGIGMFSGALLAQPRVNTMLDKVGLSFVDRIPSAWDYAFWQFKVREGGFVKIYLSDGSVTGGLVRAASTSPSQRDLFIDQVWNLDSDNNFISPVPDNIGLWVPHDEIGRLEFYQPGEEGNDEQDLGEEIFDAEARADSAGYRDSGH